MQIIKFIGWEVEMVKRGDVHVVVPENPRQFFIQTPSFVDFLGLHPIAARLYAHYIRVCGDGGECFETVETTAWYCECGLQSVRRYRKELANTYSLIKFYTPDNPRNPQRNVPHIVVRDHWLLNAKFLGVLEVLSAKKLPRNPDVRMVLRDWICFKLGAPRVFIDDESVDDYAQNKGYLSGRATTGEGVRPTSQVGVRATCEVAKEDPLYKEDPFVKKILSDDDGRFGLLPFGQRAIPIGSSSRIEGLADELVLVCFGDGGWDDWDTYKTGLEERQFEALVEWLYKASNRVEVYAEMGVGFYKTMLADGQKAGLRPDERERLANYLETGNIVGLFG